MNNPNPFVPKGSILELQSKRRSRLKLAVFCSLAVGVAGLSAMLIQGCKREQPAETDTSTPAIDTNLLTTAETNTAATETNTAAYTPPPQPLPTPVPQPAEPAGTEYVVVKGDSFEKIAKKFGVSTKAVEDANHGIAPTKLKVGQKLQIPAPTAKAIAPAAMAGGDTGAETYTVKSGDNLSKIATAHGTTVKMLQSENNLTTTAIKVGQKLKIPAKTAAAPVVAAPDPASAAPMTPPSPTPAH